MIVVVSSNGAQTETEAEFTVTFKNLKPGKQVAAAKLLSHLAQSLDDGKLDLFELATLYSNVRGLNK